MKNQILKIKSGFLKLGLCFGLITFSSAIIAQVNLEWWRTYDEALANDWARKVIVSPSGNILVMGLTTGATTADDYKVITYDPDGNVVHNFGWNENHIDTPIGFTTDLNGMVYITGYHYANWPTYYNAFTIKYDPENDQLVWKHSFSSTSVGKAIAVDCNGNTYITGDSSTMFTAKYSQNGGLIWKRGYTANSHGVAVVTNYSGNIYVTGEVGNSGTFDIATIKYNSDGDPLWTACYNYGAEDRPVDIQLDSEGNLYVLGYSWGGDAARYDYLIIKYDPEGNELWTRRYNSMDYGQWDIPRAMAVDSDDNVYVTGQANGIFGTVKYNSNGDLQWAQCWNAPDCGSDACAIALDDQANIYVTGTTCDDIGTVKYNKNGIKIWETTFQRSESQSNVATSIDLDDSGNVYITGYVSSATGSWADWITLKYSQINNYLDLSIFLEGPFNGMGMNTNLVGLPDFPFSQPFNKAPWNYNGTESVTSVPNANVVDWVLVELRDAENASSATSATTLTQQAAFLMNDGTITGLDGVSPLSFNNTPVNNLFAVVYHRNSIAVMSSGPLTTSGMGDLYSWNFTSSSGQAYGGTLAHKQIAPDIWGMIAADGNADNQVNNTDKNLIWKVQSGSSGYKAGDFNLDGQVNNMDKNLVWKPNTGSGGQVPD